MNRPRVPGSVTLGRVLLIIESVLWLVLGLLAGLAGALLIAGVRTIGTNLQTGNGVRLSVAAIGGVLIGFGVVVLVLAIVGIWSGAAMGRLGGGPRITGIVLACLGIVIGALSAIGGTHSIATSSSSGTTIRGNPIFGLVLIVLNLIIIWAIGFAGSARAAFRRLPPPGYAAAGPYIPPGYPAWPAQAQPAWPQPIAPPPPPPAPPGYPPPPPAP